jgi:hypothetical protein
VCVCNVCVECVHERECVCVLCVHERECVYVSVCLHVCVCFAKVKIVENRISATASMISNT